MVGHDAELYLTIPFDLIDAAVQNDTIFHAHLE